MIVSFDLDDTLFVSPQDFKVENELKFPWNKIYKERLRYGTISLFKRLEEMGIEIWIYTTSFRSEKYIRKLLKHYGLKVAQVINGQRHMREVQGDKKEPMPSKYPGRYRIDLHVDDDILNECKDLVNAFKELLPFYSDTSETRINSDEWDKIGQIIRKKDVKAQEIYDEASRWLKEVFSDYGCFTILGI